MTYLGARANPFCTSPGHTHQPAGLPYRASARSMVSFHSQCRGVKFYDVCITGTEWGTKLKLVKKPTTPHDPLCIVAWVPGITTGLVLKRTGLLALRRNGWFVLRRTGRTRRQETLRDTFALPNN